MLNAMFVIYLSYNKLLSLLLSFPYTRVYGGLYVNKNDGAINDINYRLNRVYRRSGRHRVGQ